MVDYMKYINNILRVLNFYKNTFGILEKMINIKGISY